MTRQPVYSGTVAEMNEQARAVLSEGFCPYCGEQLRPAPPQSDVHMEGYCTEHGLFALRRDGIQEHVTLHGLAEGFDWRARRDGSTEEER